MNGSLWFRRVCAVAVLVRGCVVAGHGLTPATRAQNASTAEVRIDNFVYGPADLSVATGTTVTWTNQDDLPHTVTSNDKIFTSKALDTDQKFSYTFTKAGTYPYYCTIHPKMTAKVVVK